MEVNKVHNKLINLAKKSNIDLEINESKTESVDIGVLNKKEKHYQVTKVKSYLIKAIKDNKCVKLEVESLKNPEKIISNIKNPHAGWHRQPCTGGARPGRD